LVILAGNACTICRIKVALARAGSILSCKVGGAMTAGSRLFARFTVVNLTGPASIAVPKQAIATVIAVVGFRVVGPRVAFASPMTSIVLEVSAHAGAAGGVAGAFFTAIGAAFAPITKQTVASWANGDSALWWGISFC